MDEVTIKLRNRSPMKFVGEEVALVSSHRDGSPRWTEMRIYRTEDGAFVFRRTGRSVMYHRPTCAAIFGRMDLVLKDDPAQSDVPCEQCLPETDDKAIMCETDKEYARVAADVRQLVFEVQERDRNSRVLTLTPMGRRLLEVTAETSPEITQAIHERMMAAASGGE